MVCKISFLLITLLILYCMYQNCTMEGLDTKQTKQTKQTHKNCEDDPTWFVMDKGGRKHTCSI